MTDRLSSTSPTVIRLTEYTKTEQIEILGDSADPFGVADAGLTWLPKEDHFGIRQKGRLVAHAGLLRLPMSIGGVGTQMVGVGGVAVAPDLRGQGLARLVVSAALEHARTMGPQHGLLFCRPPLVSLYERLGWRTLEQDVQVDQPEGPVIMPLRTMWTPLRDGANWPAGAVRLLSFPM
ncbi:GNAT family N-acetyltransferase [Streptomyces sp. PKU-EA00015]|uniref:GNAT family N-acetyltransferase n=1 Tax=Streptomyces sp. PKU-EA00015 TaxID=2748326 RepID=UPI0015A49204|nr:GNAT family N-acetyltransferase [Streptomyces sp. PKU-EA00015]NWF25356.1 GNAT family N-acetyltransferase [Streptomyces sp. PKU-EA00015]